MKKESSIPQSMRKKTKGDIQIKSTPSFSASASNAKANLDMFENGSTPPCAPQFQTPVVSKSTCKAKMRSQCAEASPKKQAKKAETQKLTKARTCKNKPQDPEKKSTTSTKSTTMKKNGAHTKKTKIIVKYDCGIPNNLFIRGEGVASLSWDKGEILHNAASDEWIWETERPFTDMEFKILINDSQYEIGENHRVSYGATHIISPKFQ